jgi:hypothetical protein
MKVLEAFLKVTILTGTMLMMLPGCTIKQANVAPDGLSTVLGLSPSFSPENIYNDWAIAKNGNIDVSQLQIVTKDGIPSLKITNAENLFIIFRRTKDMMLATPFLRWSWFIEPPSTSGYHPVRVVIGFYGGDQASRSRGSQPFRWLGSSLPAHDRTMSLTWGESALQRGTLTAPPPGSSDEAPLYTVRGGRENAGFWWLETVDLSDLYRQIWPQDDSARTQVVFIGIAASARRAPAPAHVSGITLSR